MDENTYDDNTPRRRLDFIKWNKQRLRLDISSNETNKDEERLPNNIEENNMGGCHPTIPEDKIPKEGMEFDSQDAAYEFYI